MSHPTDVPPSAPIAGTGGRPLAVVAIAVGAVMQLVVGVPFTVASGLMAPLWAIVAFGALWVACAVLVVRVARRRPIATPVVPLANAVLLWLGLTAGELFLGWTA